MTGLRVGRVALMRTLNKANDILWLLWLKKSAYLLTRLAVTG